MRLWTVVIEDNSSMEQYPEVHWMKAKGPDEAVMKARTYHGWRLDDSRVLAVFAGWHDEVYHRGVEREEEQDE